MMLMEQKTRNNTSRKNSNSSPKKSTYSGRFGTNKQSFGGGALVWLLSLTVIIAIGYYGNFGVQQTEAYPVNLMMQRKYPVNIEVENPEELISTLDNLIQNILVGIDQSHTNNMINVKSPSSGTNKRGIDLGLSRGFSGSQAAKHLMGMSAASFANGPGRRR